jgi:hypothetical protein
MTLFHPNSRNLLLTASQKFFFVYSSGIEHSALLPDTAMTAMQAMKKKRYLMLNVDLSPVISLRFCIKHQCSNAFYLVSDYIVKAFIVRKQQEVSGKNSSAATLWH